MAAKALVLIFSFLTTSYASINADYEALLKDYNLKYDNYLKQKSVWPEQIQNLKQQLSETKLAHSESLTKIEENFKYIDFAKTDFENQNQHLSFLKKLEPLSIQKQKSIKERVVSAGEFSRTEDVNLESLNTKAGELLASANTLASQIKDKEDVISNIERTNPTYTDLISKLSAVNRQIRSEREEADTLESIISSLTSEKSDLEDDLGNSKARELAARQRVIKINNTEIPRIKRNKDDAEDDVSDLKDTLKETRGKRRKARGNIKETEDEIREVEKAKRQDGADIEALDKKLVKLNKKLNRQTENFNNLDKEINGRRGLKKQIEEAEVKVASYEEEITDLEDLALDKQEEAGDEEGEQLEITDSIETLDSRIGKQQGLLKASNSRISNLNSSKSGINQEITEFRRVNIKPIESEIANLESQKSTLLFRRSDLLGWRNAIIRQDNNILKSRTLIPAQEEVVAKALSFSEEKNAEHQVFINNSNALKATHNQYVGEYNSLISNIKKIAAEFSASEEKVLNFKKEVNND